MIFDKSIILDFFEKSDSDLSIFLKIEMKLLIKFSTSEPNLPKTLSNLPKLKVIEVAFIDVAMLESELVFDSISLESVSTLSNNFI